LLLSSVICIIIESASLGRLTRLLNLHPNECSRFRFLTWRSYESFFSFQRELTAFRTTKWYQTVVCLKQLKPPNNEQMGTCHSGQAALNNEQSVSNVPVIRALFVGPHHSGKTTLISLISNIVSAADFTVAADTIGSPEEEVDFGGTPPPTSPKSVSISSFGHFNPEVMAQARYVKGALLDLVKSYAIGLFEIDNTRDHIFDFSAQQLTLLKAVSNARDLHALNNLLPKCKFRQFLVIESHEFASRRSRK
jgi:hypothetical protein